MPETRLLLADADPTSENEIVFAVARGIDTPGPMLHVEISNPWAGDSERGFGERCLIELSLDQARQVKEWLSDNLGTDRFSEPARGPDSAPE